MTYTGPSLHTDGDTKHLDNASELEGIGGLILMQQILQELRHINVNVLKIISQVPAPSISEADEDYRTTTAPGHVQVVQPTNANTKEGTNMI